MIDIKTALRVEKYYPPGGNGGPKNQYIFKCQNCSNEIKVKAKSRLKTCTGLCVKCNKGKRELFSYDEWYGMTEYFRKINE